jgi:hypothetical protein
MSDSTTICDIECFNSEGMSDAPSELREVVDRSSEAPSISNKLTSTFSIFSYVLLGSMNDEASIMEKTSMVDEDDVMLVEDEEFGHMETPTTTHGLK